MSRRSVTWFLMIAANVTIWSVLGLYGSLAAQQPGRQFGNALEQRGEMIRELREIKTLLREQNRILRSLGQPTNHEVTPQTRR